MTMNSLDILRSMPSVIIPFHTLLPYQQDFIRAERMQAQDPERYKRAAEMARTTILSLAEAWDQC
jgi:hypothetical protein